MTPLIKTGARTPYVAPEKVATAATIAKKPSILENFLNAPDPFDSPIPDDMPAYKMTGREPIITVHADVEQHSDEWYELRRGIVTASVVQALITTKTMKPANNETSRGLIAHLVAERITGHTEDVYVSADMERGTFDEPYARDHYSEHHAPVTQVGFITRHDYGAKIGYSPDGLVGDNGLIEIKSRKQKLQLKAFLDDEVPAENMGQIQCGLLASGREWCDYLSWCGGMPMFKKRVYPDERWQYAIIDAVIEAETLATRMLERYMEATAGLPPTERIEMYDSGMVI